MKQTAVEWFIEQLPIRIINSYQNEIEQAKQMEKEQIIEAHKSASLESGFEYAAKDWAIKYYNETFKSE